MTSLQNLGPIRKQIGVLSGWLGLSRIRRYPMQIQGLSQTSRPASLHTIPPELNLIRLYIEALLTLAQGQVLAPPRLGTGSAPPTFGWDHSLTNFLGGTRCPSPPELDQTKTYSPALSSRLLLPRGEVSPSKDWGASTRSLRLPSCLSARKIEQVSRGKSPPQPATKTPGRGGDRLEPSQGKTSRSHLHSHR